jgi:hypothetical protein
MRAKDTQTKQLQGTYRADRAPAVVPVEAGPRMPRGFARRDPAAAKWWHELIEVLPWLTIADGPALLLLCRHMARADEAAATMAADGVTAVDTVHGGGLKQSPAALVWARESAAAARLLGALGATVAARPARPVIDSEESLAELLFSMVAKGDT